MKLEEYTRFIQTLAQKSGDVIRHYYLSADLGVEFKADRSPVTRADREAEAIMRDLIRKSYPEHGIVGEEFGAENESAEFSWILDPIDGTISFTSGCPLFGTLIGLLHEGAPILGAIHNPVLDRLCIGDNGETRVNGKSLKMRPVDRLADAVLLATDIANIARYQQKDGFERLLAKTHLFRTWGDCYGYLLLVSGGADIMLDPVLKPWDLMPIIPIIRGAGGAITAWSGEDILSADSCVAANRSIHRQVIKVLNP